MAGAALAAMLLTGCTDLAEAETGATVPPTVAASPDPVAPIAISAAEREQCSIDPTASRLAAALATTVISAENSALALPQDLATPEQAQDQATRWAKLSDADRLYQLCLNDHQGNFGTVTSADTCDSLLTDGALASLAQANLRPRPFEPRSWDYDVLGTIDRTGIVCTWRNSGDVMLVVGKAPLDPAAWTTTRTSLLADGFVPEQLGTVEFFNGPDGDDESYPVRGVIYDDGVLFYLSDGGSYTDLAAFANR